MAKLVLKIIFLLLTVYGAVTLVKDLAPAVRGLLGQPEVARLPAVKSAIDTANQVLPENQQLSLPENSVNEPDEVTKTITQIITERITETAASTTENLKQSAHEQVCQEILTKVIDQCGQPD
jgi:hypothetical protein